MPGTNQKILTRVWMSRGTWKFTFSVVVRLSADGLKGDVEVSVETVKGPVACWRPGRVLGSGREETCIIAGSTTLEIARPSSVLLKGSGLCAFEGGRVHGDRIGGAPAAARGAKDWLPRPCGRDTVDSCWGRM